MFFLFTTDPSGKCPGYITVLPNTMTMLRLLYLVCKQHVYFIFCVNVKHVEYVRVLLHINQDNFNWMTKPICTMLHYLMFIQLVKKRPSFMGQDNSTSVQKNAAIRIYIKSFQSGSQL